MAIQEMQSGNGSEGRHWQRHLRASLPIRISRNDSAALSCAKEIPINTSAHTSGLFVQRASGTGRRQFGALLAATTLSTAPLALADEFDWLYFPMYVNDTAHAVHLKRLRFRPDGLLSAAMRYPRTLDDWSGPESQGGWYNYDESLIDCETGYAVRISTSLLDRNNETLASRQIDRSAQLDRLRSELMKESHPWPTASDRFLACAAASNTTFQQRRAAAAAQVQPLFSDRSLIETLTADTQRLLKTAELRFDFGRMARKPAAQASDLFHDLRAQYTAWRRSFNAAYVLPAANVVDDTRVLALTKRVLRDAGYESVTVNGIVGNVVEHSYPSKDFEYSLGPDETAATLYERTLTDCESGISVPVARHLVKRRQARAATHLKIKDVLTDIRASHEQASGKLFTMKAIAMTTCKAMASTWRPPVTLTATSEHRDERLPYEMDADAFAAAATPGAMLLAIRAAQRSALKAAGYFSKE